jgi:hypothetical protein
MLAAGQLTTLRRVVIRAVRNGKRGNLISEGATLARQVVRRFRQSARSLRFYLRKGPVRICPGRWLGAAINLADNHEHAHGDARVNGDGVSDDETEKPHETTTTTEGGGTTSTTQRHGTTTTTEHGGTTSTTERQGGSTSTTEHGGRTSTTERQGGSTSTTERQGGGTSTTVQRYALRPAP